MREPILKAVARPPTLFWAPMLPAMANMAVQLPVMFISIALADANPIVFATTVVLAHVGLIVAGMMEPHLSTMLRAKGQHTRRTVNAYPEKGNKFAA